MEALEHAMGQYLLYQNMLEETKPDTPLFMAIPKKAAEGIFAEPIGELAVRRRNIALIVFDPDTEEIIAWRP